MTKRLTIGHAHASAKDFGGECLSSDYVNMDTPLNFVCANGHTFSKTLRSVRHSGSWCNLCSAGIGERVCRSYFRQIFGLPFPTRKPRWLKNSLGNQMELDGYCKELGIAFEHQGRQHYKVVKHFKGTNERFKKRKADDKTKAKLCKKHGIQLVCVPELFVLTKLKDFQQWLYDECQRIGIDTPGDMLTKKISLKLAWKTSTTVKFMAESNEIAASYGGECLSTVYLTAKTKMEWSCHNPDHESWWTTYDSIMHGSWCPSCVGLKKGTIEEMQDLAKERDQGGKCLSTVYVNSDALLEWKCSSPDHESWWAAPHNIKHMKSWCPYCSLDAKERFTIEQVKESAIGWGLKCVSTEYTNIGATNLDFECPGCGHSWTTSYSLMKVRKHKCQKCRPVGEAWRKDPRYVVGRAAWEKQRRDNV
jgi:hypothetical protein